jgi:CRISPR-associated protein Cas1
MLNELAYCPRLFYLEWVEGQWRSNHFTEDGNRVHRRVDTPSGVPPEPGEEAPTVVRSLDLSDPDLGLVARVDLVELEASSAVPVDYKRGKKPDVPEGAWEPERVQLCAQGLLLRRAGYAVEAGELYFAASRARVRIPFDDVLVARTLSLAAEARAVAAAPEAPPPLIGSPKCRGCSLAPICLPDEQNLVGERIDAAPRLLFPARDDALPLHVTEPGSVLGLEKRELVVRKDGEETGRVRIVDVSRVDLHGGVRASLPALRELVDRDIPVGLFTFGGWFWGRVVGHAHKHVALRQAQHRGAEDPSRALSLARSLVSAKIRNSRTFLRRNGKGVVDSAILRDLRRGARVALEAPDLGSLLGVEGAAARRYFEGWSQLLGAEPSLDFDLHGRNRRPPRDPVNAMLSLAYALLCSEWTATLECVGFDPLLGFLHQPRYGRPALSLDLMEPFRPIVADSVVWTAIKTQVVRRDDFVTRAGGVMFTQPGKKRFLAAFERRMDHEVQHPSFGYAVSYRRIFEIQARLLARHLLGELPRYPEFLTR